jgi:hypothetical protein
MEITGVTQQQPAADNQNQGEDDNHKVPFPETPAWANDASRQQRLE